MSGRGVYLGEGDSALFGMLHAPGGDTVRATAIVIVPPLGYEGLCCARALGELADRLAARGFWVLRYDHLGTGDSAGELGDPDRLAAWVDGSRRVCAALLAATDATGVSLIGVRAGALFALAAARGNTDAKSLVLWAPPPTGRGLVREIRALSQFGEPKEEQTLIESAGFGFSPETLTELAALDVRELEPPAWTRVLVVPRDDIPPPKPSAFGDWIERAELVALPGYAAMMRDPHESVAPEPTFEAIASWLDAAHPERGARRDVLPTTEVSLRPSQAASHSVTERALRFGPGDRLFGIVTEPSPGPRGPCVLWLNPGAISRVGMNRNYVTFSRELAERGVRSFRFDVSGLGDSSRAIDSPPSLLYSEHVVPDVVAAMNMLARDFGESRFVLVGLCAGAYAAFHTALADERVSGAVLLNPQTFDYKPGDSLSVMRRQSIKAARWYRRSALDAKSWKKALRGEVDFGRIARVMGDRALSVTRTRLRDLSRGGRGPSALGASLRRLLERGVRVFLVYSADDPGLDHLREQVGHELDQLRADARFELEVVRGPDHTFTPLWSQKLLGRIVTRHLVEAHGARHVVDAPDAAEPSRALLSVARKSAKHAAGTVLPRSWLVVRGPRRRRRIALTFDDGPTELTRAYLDVLARHGVLATFFLVGRACALFPDQAASIADHGHEIGGHGFSHRTFPELAGNRLTHELERTDALLPGEKNGGRRLVRPPHGSISPRSLLQCARAGYTTVLWSYDSGDSRARTAGEILEAFERAPPENGDIVLLHEDHRHTLEALPLLLTRLEEAGYELATVGQLFQPGPRA